MGGADSHCPFVFFLCFFVSPFFPTLPMRALQHCLSVVLSSAPVCLSPSLPLSPLLASFLGLCLPCLVSVYAAVFPLFFPVAAAAPTWAGWLPWSLNSPLPHTPASFLCWDTQEPRPMVWSALRLAEPLQAPGSTGTSARGREAGSLILAPAQGWLAEP